MGFWTKIRDFAQAVGSVVGNIVLPGSSAITSRLVSKGAQEHLQSPLGTVAQIGSSLYGAGNAFSGMGATPTEAAIDAGALGGSAGPSSYGGFLGAGGSFGNVLAGGRNLLDPAFRGYNAMSGIAPSGGGGGLGSLFQIGSGLYGLGLANEQRRLAEQYAQQADPFAPYRSQFAQQLSALGQNPSMITQMPGYQAGLEAVQRSLAAQGYQGSGNMMAALQQYGGQAYANEMNRLAGLSGANLNPAAAGQLGLTGSAQGMLGSMSSLGLLGGGLQRAGF